MALVQILHLMLALEPWKRISPQYRIKSPELRQNSMKGLGELEMKFEARDKHERLMTKNLVKRSK